ncbi:transcriptional repressor [Alicyclobacillus hesperidum subsp. aegles]|nr:transcriptional repressor [Alicyclobacillus hesperidum subsp. aegles]
MVDLKDIQQLLHEHKFRLTKEREAVLMAFVDARRMFTPAQLHDYVKERYERVGLTTVYRLLEALTKVGLATPFLIDGEIYYTFCPNQHHHHFVCLQCHQVKELFQCNAQQAMDVDQKIGTVAYHKLDFFGRCRSCEEERH